MRKHTEQFVENIRGADQSVKNFWSLVFSGVATLLIVGLWVGYGLIFNRPNTQVAETAAEENAERVEEVATLREAFDEAFENFNSITDSTRNVLIDPEERDFVYDELEPIPPTPLP